MSTESSITLTTEHSILLKTHGQIEIEWEIKKFFDLAEEKGLRLESKPFLLLDAEWFLQIYPNDFFLYSQSWICFYLVKNVSPSQIDADLTFGIRKVDGSMLVTVDKEKAFNIGEDYCGSNILILLSELHKYKNVVAPEGNVTFCCSIRFRGTCAAVGVEARLPNSSLESVNILQKNLKDLLLSEQNNDVTVNVQGQAFRAHWLILAARSSIFASMYNHDTSEKQTGIVNITDCSPESFKDFLCFLYTGNTDVVTSGNAVSLYKTADKYNVQDLKKECARCMAEELSIESFCDVILLANMHDETKILATATNFFIENVDDILPTSQWVSFMKEHTTLSNELLIKMVKRHKSPK